MHCLVQHELPCTAESDLGGVEEGQLREHGGQRTLQPVWWVLWEVVQVRQRSQATD